MSIQRGNHKDTKTGTPAMYVLVPKDRDLVYLNNDLLVSLLSLCDCLPPSIICSAESGSHSSENS